MSDRTKAPVTKRPKDLDFRGDLQAELMTAIWKLGEATVEQVREVQPRSRLSAYNTVQTVLNRLTDRGLLVRKRKGRAFVYRPALEESEFVALSIAERLDGASPDARRAALVNLVDNLDAGEIDEIARRANRIKRSRGKR